MELPRIKTCAMKYLCGPKDADLRELPNPRWTDIELAIRQLNGDDRTLVSFGSGTPASHMAIGGGRDGKYIVYATHDNITFTRWWVTTKVRVRSSSLLAGNQVTI